MVVEMISVGTEILLGDILNTNVQFLSRLCAHLGLDVYHTSVVGDNERRLHEELALATSRSDIVILTGGLGSTDDDITKRVVIDFLHQGVIEDHFNREVIDQWFEDEKAKRDNQIVYSFPSGSTVLKNHVGTASGAWIPYQRDDKSGVIVILPGPPDEMIPMVERELTPLLLPYSEGVTKSLVVRFGVLGEYRINEILKEEIEKGENPTFAPYVKPDGALIRITAKSAYEREADRMISGAMQTIQDKLGKYIVAIGQDTRSEVLVRLLKDRKAKVSVAESLTGGMVASTIIDAPGASDVLEQSFVVYSDRAKHKVLTVPKKKIREHTAVSSSVCKSMLAGLYTRTGAELCLATTGYAGPTGEDVGHCFIGVMLEGKKHIYEHHFHGDRSLIRSLARNLAIDYAILTLKEKDPNALILPNEVPSEKVDQE